MPPKKKSPVSDMASKSVNINIQPFSGEPDSVEWFTNQLLSLKEINGWPENVAILHLKSKLIGTAQSWFSNSPTCKKIQTLNEACEALVEFFKNDTNPSQNLVNFQNIKLLPQETVKNLSHRIESLAHLTYPMIKEQTAINNIMSLQLLSALPSNIKKHLLSENIDNFQNLVTKASNIQMAESTLNVTTNSITSNNNDDMNSVKKQITDLAQQLNETINKCSLCHEHHTLAQCQLFHQIINKPQENIVANLNSQQPQPSGSQIHCIYCQKNGHAMANCRLYAASLHQSSQFNPNLASFRYPNPRPNNQIYRYTHSHSRGNFVPQQRNFHQNPYYNPRHDAMNISRRPRRYHSSNQNALNSNRRHQ